MSTLETHRVWGTCAVAGYLLAALVMLGPDGERTRAVAVGAALAGAVFVPFTYLLVSGAAQSEVEVIERAGRLLVERATPYLEDPRSVDEVTPYLPGMALFGLPRVVLGADGPFVRVLGDARLWCAAVLFGCLWAGRRAFAGTSTTADRRGHLMAMGALTASPVVALPLVVSGVDLPLTGLLCLALALAARGRPVAAGLALAGACALKWTAWPAVPVVMALLAHRAGLRAAVRSALVGLAGTAVALLPGLLFSPRAMAEQVLAFPTGRGDFTTPASSPMPGRLLADLGPAGWYAAVGLLLAGGLAVGVSLLLRPPRDLVGAADRLALGLSLAFLLAPAGRFGYLALPVLLVVWSRLVRQEGLDSGWRGSRVVAGGFRNRRRQAPAPFVPAAGVR
ncbi:glycosyltransferase 87 family protein [Streptomyces sp. 2132.2]|uniref:glycosyltransferase 87 family protein n=1 Tax=Streptomyces sp. 2132.2 TaxID=2485161 RepID=UPI0021A5DEBC|nr:glycosyltransferase 87 family protein [Streptomyces sp. 2132.2]